MARVIDVPAYPTAHEWPVTLRYGRLLLTPFRRRDVDEVSAVRTRNISWLSPWDATSPKPSGVALSSDKRARFMWDQAVRGVSVPWLIRWAHLSERPVIGQCTISNIIYGSAQCASIGYWIDQRYAGRSITPAAVAMATDYAFSAVGLHRIEICIRPENTPSLRVVEKLGFRYEGLRPRYIHIAGDWRDHEVFALTPDEVPEGVLARAPEVVGNQVRG
ncbi:MAG: GNAT family N-acetyltransferase [Propionibacteriaceae bacterium]|nr:GNAT family N-acetyltransferase [Propionibacteriaceae bacterium]